MDMSDAELENKIRDYVEREVGRQITAIQSRLTATPSRTANQWLVVGEDGAPDYGSGWAATPTVPLAIWKDPLSNIVYLRGSADMSSGTFPTTVLSLPPGYEPPQDWIILTSLADMYITTGTTGNLVVDSVDPAATPPQTVVFDNITWGANVSNE